MPRQRREGFLGTMQTDAYEVYQALERKDAALERIGRLASYFLHKYDAMRGYLVDGRFEIDNNLVENDIRPTAAGR